MYKTLVSDRSISRGRERSLPFFPRLFTHDLCKAGLAARVQEAASLLVVRLWRSRWPAIALLAITAQSVWAGSQGFDATPARETPPPARAALVPATAGPARQLRVRYQNGELTIEADNAALDEILRSVSKETGSVIDVPSVAHEPVVRHLGPGPVVDVLDALLKPSRLNYAIFGTASHGGTPVLVILSVRPSAPAVARQVENPAPLQASVATAPAPLSGNGESRKPGGSGAPRQEQALQPSATSVGAVTAWDTQQEASEAETQRQQMQTLLEQRQQMIQQGLLERLNARGGEVAEDSQAQPDSQPQAESQPETDSQPQSQ